jgi:hypothetical protein
MAATAMMTRRMSAWAAKARTRVPGMTGAEFRVRVYERRPQLKYGDPSPLMMCPTIAATTRYSTAAPMKPPIQ